MMNGEIVYRVFTLTARQPLFSTYSGNEIKLIKRKVSLINVNILGCNYH